MNPRRQRQRRWPRIRIRQRRRRRRRRFWTDVTQEYGGGAAGGTCAGERKGRAVKAVEGRKERVSTVLTVSQV